MSQFMVGHRLLREAGQRSASCNFGVRFGRSRLTGGGADEASASTLARTRGVQCSRPTTNFPVLMRADSRADSCPAVRQSVDEAQAGMSQAAHPLNDHSGLGSTLAAGKQFAADRCNLTADSQPVPVRSIQFLSAAVRNRSRFAVVTASRIAVKTCSALTTLGNPQTAIRRRVATNTRRWNRVLNVSSVEPAAGKISTLDSL